MQHRGDARRPASFAGFICLWRMQRNQAQSRREQFFSAYEDLRRSVVQCETQRGEHGPRWKMVRISEPGRRFFGLVRG